MKNFFKTTFITMAFLTIGAIQVFATNVNIYNPGVQYINNNIAESQYIDSNDTAEAKSYRKKANAIRSEINTITIQIKELKEYNAGVNAKLKALNEQYKTDKSIISSDNMRQIKELRKSIKTVETPEKTVTEDGSIKTLVQNKEYDRALAKLNETLENKKTQLKTLQERTAIWRQIDALIR